MDESSASTFSGEQRLGGCLAYGPDDETLPKATDVIAIAAGGFDWGEDADEAKFLQLAVAILTEKFSKYKALDLHHEFATWLADEIGDAEEWAIPASEITSQTYNDIADPAFENRAPDADDVDLAAIDPQTVSFAELVALCRAHGLNEFQNEVDLRTKLCEIKQGDLDPEPVATTSDSEGEDEQSASDAGDTNMDGPEDTGSDSPGQEQAPLRVQEKGNAVAPATVEATKGTEAAVSVDGATQVQETNPSQAMGLPDETATVTRQGAFDMVDIPGAAADPVAIDYEAGPVPRVMIRTPQGAALDVLPERGESDFVVLSVQLADAVAPADRTILAPDDERSESGVPASEATTMIESIDEFDWGATGDKDHDQPETGAD